jgi:hypothetical protein
MKKKATLSSALLAASGRTAPQAERVSAPEAAADLSVSSLNVTSREGKKAIAGFFDPAVSRQLKQIGLERDMSVQELMREAFNDYFEKHGRSRIA